MKRILAGCSSAVIPTVNPLVLLMKKPPALISELSMLRMRQAGVQRHNRIMSYFTLLYFTYFSRTLLPSASSGYTIGRLSLTQLFTSVIGIPISLYHLGTSSSQRFRDLPLGRRPSGWITSALLWGAVGALLLTCDHHLILFLFPV